MVQERDIRRSKHQVVVPMLVFFLGVPFLVVAHEVGHFLAAKAFGYQAHLSYAAVNFTLPKSDLHGIPRATIAAAGPLTNLLMAFLGFIGLLYFSKALKPSRMQWIVIWILTLLVSGGARGLLKALSPSGSDEAYLAERFGCQVALACSSWQLRQFCLHAFFSDFTIEEIRFDLSSPEASQED